MQKNNETRHDIKVLRVTQLDTNVLDTEFLNQMKTYLYEDTFKYLRASSLNVYQVELFAVLKGLIWYSTYGRTERTIGQALLNWSYKNDGTYKATRMIMHCLIYCLDEWTEIRLLPLLSARIRHFNAFRIFFKFSRLLNYLIFLYNGDYLHLWERLFRLKPFYKQMQTLREINTKYTERLVLWQSYFVLIKFLNTTFDLKLFLKKLRMKISNNNETDLTMASRDDAMSEHFRVKHCGICNDRLTLACQSNSCQHFFCFYCVQFRIHKENDNSCPICKRQFENVDLCVNYVFDE